jgi:hypothetical protein
MSGPTSSGMMRDSGRVLREDVDVNEEYDIELSLRKDVGGYVGL